MAVRCWLFGHKPALIVADRHSWEQCERCDEPISDVDKRIMESYARANRES